MMANSIDYTKLERIGIFPSVVAVGGAILSIILLRMHDANFPTKLFSWCWLIGTVFFFFAGRVFHKRKKALMHAIPILRNAVVGHVGHTPDFEYLDNSADERAIFVFVSSRMVYLGKGLLPFDAGRFLSPDDVRKVVFLWTRHKDTNEEFCCVRLDLKNIDEPRIDLSCGKDEHGAMRLQEALSQALCLEISL